MAPSWCGELVVSVRTTLTTPTVRRPTVTTTTRPRTPDPTSIDLCTGCRRLEATDLQPRTGGCRIADTSRPPSATLRPMVIGGIATALILIITVTMSLGFGVMRSRADKEAGRSLLARGRILLYSCLYGGAAIGTIGAIGGVGWVEDFGLLVIFIGIAIWIAVAVMSAFQR